MYLARKTNLNGPCSMPYNFFFEKVKKDIFNLPINLTIFNCDHILMLFEFPMMNTKKKNPRYFILLFDCIFSPYLTWRDIQHLIIWTSEHLPVSENPGWSRNSAGLWFNTRFGFGLMNAYSMVITAANWTNVPDKQICNISSER